MAAAHFSARGERRMLAQFIASRGSFIVFPVVIALIMLVTSSCGGKRAKLKVARIGATEQGIASWYGHPYHGRRAANGEIYDMEKLTAAHRTLPFGTWLRVRNLSNEKTVDVRIQDRGPFIDGRIIDLSRAAAREIDLIGPGISKVKLTVIARPSNPEAARTEPVVTAPVPSSPPSELFGVQVGAFSDRERAEDVSLKMRERYGAARIAVKEGGSPLFRVLAGAYPYIEDAQALLDRIRHDGGTGFVVRLDQ